jgi:hypothetical protein
MDNEVWHTGELVVRISADNYKELIEKKDIIVDWLVEMEYDGWLENYSATWKGLLSDATLNESV